MKTTHVGFLKRGAWVLALAALAVSPPAVFAQGKQQFDKPMQGAYRLDWCFHWGKHCGKPAANAWCKKKYGKADGYAIDFRQAADIGLQSPTYVLGDKRVCRAQFCDGFEWILCGFSLD